MLVLKLRPRSLCFGKTLLLYVLTYFFRRMPANLTLDFFFVKSLKRKINILFLVIAAT